MIPPFGNFLCYCFLLFLIALKHFRKAFIGEDAACVLLENLFNKPVDFGDSLCALFNRQLQHFVFFLTHSIDFLCKYIQKYRHLSKSRL